MRAGIWGIKRDKRTWVVMVVDNFQSNTLFSTDISEVIRRLCEHLGIAYAGNRLMPALSEISNRGDWDNDCQQLNLLGQNFGIRFRELNGRTRELVNTVQNAGPVLVSFAGSESSIFESLGLVLPSERGNRIVFIRDGQETVVTKRQLMKFLGVNSNDEFHFYLAQPLLASEAASRFHYQTGTPGERLKPFQRFVSMLRPEAKDLRAIFVFSVIVGLLGLTTPLAVEAVVNTIAFGQYLQPLIVLSLIVLTFLGFLAGLNVLMSTATNSC